MSSHLVNQLAAPPNGVMKVNCDAYLNVKDRYVGIGIVTWDYHGNFMFARVITKIVVGSPKVVEAMAALEAVLFCKEAGFFNVILQGNAKQVVNDVNAGSTDLWEVRIFVEDIQSELKGLMYVKVVQVGIDSNNVAHVLTKEASAKILDIAWLEDSSDFLVYVLNRDRLCPQIPVLGSLF
jgi:ribonuclease HI